MKTLTFQVPNNTVDEQIIHCLHHYVSRNQVLRKLMADALAATPLPSPRPNPDSNRDSRNELQPQTTADL